MKASVEFREEQGPLFRAKLPISVGSIPISSGIALGHSQEDLTLHVGTLFESGPSCRVAYRPMDSFNPLSFVVKTGFGLWGSPNAAPLTMAAEFHLSSKGGGGPRFLIRMKPRIGDFGLRKCAGSNDFAKQPSFLPDLSRRSSLESTLSGSDEKSLAELPQPSAAKTGNLLPFLKTPESNIRVLRSEPPHTPTFPFNIEFLENEKKARSEREQKNERDCGRMGLTEEFSLKQSLKEELKNERDCGRMGLMEEFSSKQSLKEEGSTAIASLHPDCKLPSLLQGWKVHANSGLSLGSLVRVNVSWGMTMPLDRNSQAWDSSRPLGGMSLSQLPTLHIHKISIEKSRSSLVPNNKSQPSSIVKMSQPSPSEDDSHGFVASLKHRLQCLYAENEFLRRSMDGTKSPVLVDANEEVVAGSLLKPHKKLSNLVETKETKVQGVAEKANLARKEFSFDTASNQSGGSNLGPCSGNGGGSGSLTHAPKGD